MFKVCTKEQLPRSVSCPQTFSFLIFTLNKNSLAFCLDLTYTHDENGNDAIAFLHVDSVITSGELN